VPLKKICFWRTPFSEFLHPNQWAEQLMHFAQTELTAGFPPVVIEKGPGVKGRARWAPFLPFTRQCAKIAFLFHTLYLNRKV
jgi:hypothetical protein